MSKPITKRALAVAEKAIALQVQANWLNEQLEDCKDKLKAYAGRTLNVPDKGVVRISKEGGGKPYKTTYLNLDKFEALPAKEQRELIRRGIVSTKEGATNTTKPKVTITPNV